MDDTISKQLYEFAKAFPIDPDACDEVWDITNNYITDTLSMKYYHVMVDGKLVNGKPGLETPRLSRHSWCNDGADTVQINMDNSSSYKAQSTFAYKEQKPIWITALNRGPLHMTDKYEEQWSHVNANSLPTYENDKKKDVKTSIVIPLPHGAGHVFGFLCLESDRYLEISDQARSDFLILAKSIGATLFGYEDYQNKKSGTKIALRNVREFCKENQFSPLSKPKVFVASSNSADDEVITIIKEIVEDSVFGLEGYYWKEDQAIGAIAIHLNKIIAKCRFGIFYFSESGNSSNSRGSKYSDNPNVMFEAGMMRSLAHVSATAPKAWIPIREEDSPDPPFDISHERMIIVERNDDNSIKKKEFSIKLRSMLQLLVDQYYPHYGNEDF
jgi:hypothetical protein